MDDGPQIQPPPYTMTSLDEIIMSQEAAARWQTLSLTRLADNLGDGERADNWETTRRRAPLSV